MNQVDTKIAMQLENDNILLFCVLVQTENCAVIYKNYFNLYSTVEENCSWSKTCS